MSTLSDLQSLSCVPAKSGHGLMSVPTRSFYVHVGSLANTFGTSEFVVDFADLPTVHCAYVIHRVAVNALEMLFG